MNKVDETNDKLTNTTGATAVKLAAGVKIKYAVLHDTLFIPGDGQFGPTLTEAPSATQKAVKMLFKDGILEVSTAKNTMLVPVQNIKGMLKA